MLSLGGPCQALGKGVGKTDKGAPGEEAWDTENLVGSWWFFLCSVVPPHHLHLKTEILFLTAFTLCYLFNMDLFQPPNRGAHREDPIAQGHTSS